MFETQAAVYRKGNEVFSLEPISLDNLQAKEILVELEATGICHMDLAGRELVEPPAIYGHEGVGVVVEVGAAVTRVKRGDRVIMSYGSCGYCPNCDEGKPFHCDSSWDMTFTGRRLDGSATAFLNGEPLAAAFFQQSSFANHSITLEDGLVPVNTELPPEILAALPCGVLTGMGVVTEQFAVRPGASIAVFGAGAVGLSAVMAARIVGAHPIVAIDINDDRLALAEDLGASMTINPKEGDVAKILREKAPRGVQFCIDTTGNAQAFQSAIDSLGVGGALAACILPSPMDAFAFKPLKLFEQAASLNFVSFGNAAPKTAIPKMIELYRRGLLPVDRLTSVFPFAEINRACAEAKSGEVIKPILTF